MVAAAKIESDSLMATYDAAVDVLYVAKDAPADVEGTGLAGGIELDYSVETGAPCAVTVLGLDRNGWLKDKKLTKLAEVIGEHLSANPERVRDDILMALLVSEPRAR
jgi:hypothetical protein